MNEAWRDEWDDASKTEEWLEEIARREFESAPDVLRCVFHTRLIVPGTKVPSGTKYEADPQQIIRVRDEDRKTLLDMTRDATGCRGCGGGRATEPQHYFEEVVY